MPQAPSIPADMAQSIGQTNPVNFLMAAAEAHSRGDFQSAPVPHGLDLQSGKAASRKKHIQVVK